MIFSRLLPEALDASAEDCVCLSFPLDAPIQPVTSAPGLRDRQQCVFCVCVCVPQIETEAARQRGSCASCVCFVCKSEHICILCMLLWLSEEDPDWMEQTCHAASMKSDGWAKKKKETERERQTHFSGCIAHVMHK